MANDLHVSAGALLLLKIILDVLFSLYLPLLEASLEQDYNIIRSNNLSNSLLLTSNLLFQSYYQLLGQLATCAQSIIPRPRIEGVLFLNFLRSEFERRDFFSELRRCANLFWSLTGESIQSFLHHVVDSNLKLLFSQYTQPYYFSWRHLTTYARLLMSMPLYRVTQKTVIL